MRMTLRQLKKMSVETVSGVKLGRVCDIVFETDGQSILQYEVCGGLFCGERYLINRSQVVRFEEKKMIVEDNVTSVESVEEKRKGEVIAEVGATMRVTSDQ